MTNPTPPFTKQLRVILENFNGAGIETTGYEYWDQEEYDESIEEAITAIEAAVLELIGEDEPVPANPELQIPGDTLVKGLRNGLRAELRVQLREGPTTTSGGDNE